MLKDIEEHEMDKLTDLKRFICFFYMVFKVWFLLHFIHKGKDKVHYQEKIAQMAGDLIKKMGIKVIIDNQQKLTSWHGMLVSNHISWLEIVAIRAYLPVYYIAKIEVQNFPFLGRIAQALGSIFISRQQKTTTSFKVKQVTNSLIAGNNVVLFPEATTSDGTNILPFKVSYFQAAIDAQAAVLPIMIKYLNANGSINTKVAYWDDINLIESVWQIAKQRDVTLHINVLEAIDSQGLNAVECAQQAREAIVKAFRTFNVS